MSSPPFKQTQTSLATQWAAANWKGRDFWVIPAGSVFNPFTRLW